MFFVLGAADILLVGTISISDVLFFVVITCGYSLHCLVISSAVVLA